MNDKILSDFAFHHLKGNKVAMRLLMDYDSEAARGSEDQLGILLPIPQGLKQDLIDASHGKNGFLMKDADKFGQRKHYSRTFPLD